METAIEKTIAGASREEFRMNLINLFLNEKHGDTMETTYYYYYVERANDGTEIFLKRPTQLNKGVDFEVRVKGINFRYGKKGNIISTGNRPSHGDIINDLKLKRENNKDKFEILKSLITSVYQCEDIDSLSLGDCIFDVGLPIDLLLRVFKWLFIEQDITYWNKSGREMFYNAIMKLWEK